MSARELFAREFLDYTSPEQIHAREDKLQHQRDCVVDNLCVKLSELINTIPNHEPSRSISATVNISKDDVLYFQRMTKLSQPDLRVRFGFDPDAPVHIELLAKEQTMDQWDGLRDATLKATIHRTA